MHVGLKNFWTHIRVRRKKNLFRIETLLVLWDDLLMIGESGPKEKGEFKVTDAAGTAG